jgi:cytochrome b6-f complex iron-sulfur subunit
MHRRGFIKNCGIVCSGALGISAILQSCGSLNYFAQSTIVNNSIAVNKSEFVSLKDGKGKSRNFVLIKTEKLQFPIFLHKNSETEYAAFLMQCTHKGCELQPQGEFLICPCHGSEFDSNGKVLNPPADQNLQQFITTTDNNTIYIQL